jgi:hypothetical protein
MVGCVLAISLLWVPQMEQDRWEDINPLTLAICIAALVAGADLLPSPASDWAVELADVWNSNIERGTSVFGTPLAKLLDVSGYETAGRIRLLRAVVPVQILDGRKSFTRLSRSTTALQAALCQATNWSALSFFSSSVSAYPRR